MFIRECICDICGFKWNGLFPEGLEEGKKPECPNCKENKEDKNVHF